MLWWCWTVLLLFSLCNGEQYVQMVYVVPSGVLWKAESWQFAQHIGTRVQQFIGQQLRRTFQLWHEHPYTIRSRYSIADITNGTLLSYRWPTLNGNIAQHLVDVLRSEHAELLANNVSFIAVTEIDTWCARAGQFFASHCTQEMALISSNPTFLYPFDHETGHLLGLKHNSDTVACLLQNPSSAPIMPEPTSIMAQPPLNPSIMTHYEKQILLDPLYFGRACVIWPHRVYHPSEYFTVCLASPDINTDGTVTLDDLSTLLYSWRQSCIACAADLNCDNVVDINDLSLLLLNWGPINAEH